MRGLRLPPSHFTGGVPWGPCLVAFPSCRWPLGRNSLLFRTRLFTTPCHFPPIGDLSVRYVLAVSPGFGHFLATTPSHFATMWAHTCLPMPPCLVAIRTLFGRNVPSLVTVGDPFDQHFTPVWSLFGHHVPAFQSRSTSPAPGEGSTTWVGQGTMCRPGPTSLWCWATSATRFSAR